MTDAIWCRYNRRRYSHLVGVDNKIPTPHSCIKRSWDATANQRSEKNLTQQQQHLSKPKYKYSNNAEIISNAPIDSDKAAYSCTCENKTFTKTTAHSNFCVFGKMPPLAPPAPAPAPGAARYTAMMSYDLIRSRVNPPPGFRRSSIRILLF
ncbi:hypothetical protein EVAR_41154_1 [Eumeta japonica]|uniref:Uncharacterized protein n=1 Tax=Eumeta variegata TaxID=151549 RepID=A0A4C1YEP5_EUMVA|nr:hypothetical protein EVAR_41154_1 [Eumeta japonica]